MSSNPSAAGGITLPPIQNRFGGFTSRRPFRKLAGASALGPAGRSSPERPAVECRKAWLFATPSDRGFYSEMVTANHGRVLTDLEHVEHPSIAVRSSSPSIMSAAIVLSQNVNTPPSWQHERTRTGIRFFRRLGCRAKKNAGGLGF